MNHEDKPLPADHTGSAADALTPRILDGIDPSNVAEKPHLVEIRLWPEWTQMLRTLPDLGEVLVMTGNSCAVLGKTAEYPHLEFCREARHAHNGDGSFDFEFIPWASALAVTKRCVHRASHFIEFRDHTGTVIHKVCLTEKTNQDRFIEWVQYHQALPGIFPRSVSDLSADRWRTVQQRHWFDYDEVDIVDPLAISAVLRESQEMGMPINVVVGNEGVVQSAELVPQRIHPFQQWTFVSDDIVGLHLDQTSMVDVIVHHTPAARGMPPGSALKCFDECGALRFAITPGSSVPAAEWRAFLKETTKYL